MDELLNDFLVETAEHIESAGEQLVLFERNPSDGCAIDRIFRLFHTIKGTCGFLGLSRLETLTHVTESLISRLRDGAPATPEIVSLILAAVDRVKFILTWLAKTEQEPEGDDTVLIDALQANIVTSLRADESTPLLETMAAEAAPAVASSTGVAGAAPVEIATAPVQPGRTTNRSETIRVAVGALERIMILVSELVLTRNQLLEITRHREDTVAKAPLQRLPTLTTDLRDAVMRARMQPVGRLFASLPRLVRELAVELKKKLYLVTEGADTELDRQLVELIRDPLTHLLRNCADHGIETPERRIALGKPEEGTIKVTATHEAGYITIDVSDDGRGPDLERIREKGLANGLTTVAEAKDLSDDAKFDAVVTDTDMPNINGYALARRLTGDPRHAGMPVLALAAHAAPTVMETAAASGMCGAVGKFDRSALLEMLGRNLELHYLNKPDHGSRVIGAVAA
jgi:two-component system, chemotaxis family, sensor kinase CheA